MMTLIEAVEHCKDMAKCEYGECAEEHKQLAEWLMELQDIKTHGKRTETHGVRSDLIRRQDVYDALEQYDREHVEPQGYDDYYNGFLHAIESLPSVDVGDACMWICDNCGLDVHIDYDECPRCGHERRKRT